MLQEATFEMTATAFTKEKEADKSLYVQFYSDAIPDAIASDEEGRLICREVDFVMIMVPGDKHSIIRRPVQKRDIERFGDRYSAYKAGKAQEAASGTPLHTVSWLSKAQVKELEFLGVHTLENLAGMPDSVAQKFMAVQGLKQRAKDAIAAAKEAAPLLALRTEIEQKDVELDALRKMQAEQAAQIKQLQDSILGAAQVHQQLESPRARAAR